MVEPTDIEDVMEQVRSVVNGGQKISPLTFLASADKEATTSDLNHLWHVDPEISAASERPLLGPIDSLFKRLVRKSTRWQILPIVVRINGFHAAVVNVLNRMNKRVETVESFTAEQRAETNAMRDHITETVDQRLWQLERSVKNISRAMKDVVKDDKILQNQEVAMREVQNLDYIGFENQYRGQESLIKDRQSDFLRFFLGRERVLDIGCGRGEFLEILRENGIEASGVDFDQDMVDHCRSKGLEVSRAECIAYLRGLKDNHLGGIFIGQVVEHLTSPELMELTELCKDKLEAGGYLVIETINPLCLSVFSNTFYLDISHQKPVHPGFLRFHLESLGFKDLELILISPVEDEKKLQPLDQGSAGLSHDKIVINENFEKLNQLLFSFQDYVMAAKKQKSGSGL